MSSTCPSSPRSALNSRGIARVGLGEFERGVADLEASIALTRGRDAPEFIRGAR